MSAWHTYRLEDFVPFTPDIYWRLLERVNEAFWPLHILAVAIGLTALLLALRGKKRLALALLAPAWLTSGILFHFTYYAELNWAAPWFGWSFIAQASLLLAFAFFAGPIKPQATSKGLSTWIGTTVAVVSLLGYPLIAATLGPGLTHAETYGLHPDPTAIATLGVLLIVLRGAGRRERRCGRQDESNEKTHLDTLPTSPTATQPAPRPSAGAALCHLLSPSTPAILGCPITPGARPSTWVSSACFRSKRFTRPARFGFGDPARARAIQRFAAPEWVVQLGEIRRFEDYPLYLVSPEDPNALVDGIRLELCSGVWLVVANDAKNAKDAKDAADRFEAQLENAMRGHVATLPFSQYLTTRERDLRHAGLLEVRGVRIDTTEP